MAENTVARVDMLRRPLAKLLSRQPESRDERVTVRLTPTQREMFAGAALSVGTELSRYIRDCACMGHSIREAQSILKATGA